MAKLRLLSKSRFKLAAECPTKLFFTGKPEFGNNNLDNAFLEALAEGGFQVGELAKLYYHGGHEVEDLDSEIALKRTAELMKQDKVTLYEPAFKFGKLLVRVDVLVKSGKTIKLVEVKAKSFDKSESNPFYNKKLLKKGIYKLSADWEPYLLDVAFQKFVLSKCLPGFVITASLMLADKRSVATVDGLNQFFILEKDDSGRTKSRPREGVSQKDLGDRVLIDICVDDEVKLIHEDTYLEGRTFEEHVEHLAAAYSEDRMLTPSLSTACKSCEFRISKEKKSEGLKSGFDLCWKTAAKLSETDLEQPMIFDIWNFRKTEDLLFDGVYFLKDLSKDDIAPKPGNSEGLSISERQWLQVEKVQRADPSPFIDVNGLTHAMSAWKFPLHFIDFETTMVAIPFNKGRRPYEQIAFQFSHHVVTKDGSIEHKDQFIFTERGQFPNFDFVRALKKCLEKDNGTIFRYATHENSVLCQIHQQLSQSNEKDREELMDWIETVTASSGDTVEGWQGHRNMVDLCELVKLYFYHPLTKGSNSIKKVLPAILNASQHLQTKYSVPAYGDGLNIKSHNYKNWVWISKSPDGSVKDPYKLLPPIYDGVDPDLLDGFLTDGSIADGGAAMTAFARMQFTEMKEHERDAVKSALLKYCELDTFAMVLIYEYWKHEVSNAVKKDSAA